MRHYKITVGDAFEAHFEAISHGGGLAGTLDLGLLESALARPYSGYYRPIACKAAALLHGVVKNHPFLDGNKRTALLLTLILIVRSGYRLKLDPEERIDDMVVAVASSEMSFEELVDWFKLRIRLSISE